MRFFVYCKFIQQNSNKNFGQGEEVITMTRGGSCRGVQDAVCEEVTLSKEPGHGSYERGAATAGEREEKEEREKP